MRPLFLAVLLGLVATPYARAAQSADALLSEGLKTFVTNGPEAAVHAWYQDRPELAAEMERVVMASTARLGSPIDTEIVATQRISTRVTRVFVAVYFSRAPLWIRLERYDNGEKTFLLPLKCSTNPDEILPGYITEFSR